MDLLVCQDSSYYIMWLFSFDKEYSGWTLERISRHVLWWGWWLTFYGVVNGSHYEHRYGDYLQLELFIMITVKIPYAYFVIYYLIPKYLPEKRYLPLTVGTVGGAVLGILLILEINESLPFSMDGQPTKLLSMKTFYRVMDLIYGISLIVLIKMLQQYSKHRSQNAQLKEEKTNAELQILKNQLQPHFLFNTLNNIYGMVLSGNREAADSVLRLSDMMSYMLYDCRGELVALDKELAFIKNYIELEKLRYGNRLELSLEVAGSVKGKMVSPLLLLPFVENAFKHGASASEKCAWIRINLQSTDDALVFLIENSLPETAAPQPGLKSGIGLANVRKRLELLFPQRHQLKIRNEDSYLLTLSLQL